MQGKTNWTLNDFQSRLDAAKCSGECLIGEDSLQSGETILGVAKMCLQAAAITARSMGMTLSDLADACLEKPE